MSGVPGKGSPHTPGPAAQGVQSRKVTRDLDQVLPVPLTVCGVLGEVFNVSSANTSSIQSSETVSIKFTPVSGTVRC